ncbi:molecular chaperone LpfB [Enterobacteriaceae bacterium 89]|nr:molecular chaperone LpfB [Enterobacteriaceae bacterium 89]
MKRSTIALGSFFFMTSICSAQGISMSTTRVIYSASQKEASLTVQNHSDTDTYLVQSWIDDRDGSKKTPFVITPPLVQMKPGGNNALRIVNINANLPQDRESVYWVNVKAIPALADGSENKNLLQIAIRTRLKLFYRPAGLTGDTVSSAKQLTFSPVGSQIKVNNPSPFVITFHDLTINGKTVKESVMVPAKTSLNVPLPAGVKNPSQVQYTVINDFGSASPSMSQSVH